MSGGHHGPYVPGETTEQYEKEVHEKAREILLVAKGYHLTNPPNPTIEAGRIGIADNVAAALGNDWQEKIFDPTVRQGLRNWLKEKYDKEKEMKNIFERAGMSLKNLVLNATSPIDYYFDEKDTYGRKFEEEFGKSKKLSDMKLFVIDKLKNDPNSLNPTPPLTKSQLLGVLAELGNTVPPPPTMADVAAAISSATTPLSQTDLDDIWVKLGNTAPPPPTMADVAAAISSATTPLSQTDLDDIWVKLGNTVPPPPTMADVATALMGAPPMVLKKLQHNPIFKDSKIYSNLFKLRLIEAEETDKLLNPILVERERLADFIEEIKRDAPGVHKLLTETLLEKEALENLEMDPATKALLKELQTRYMMALGPPPATPAAKAAAAANLDALLKNIQGALPGIEEKKAGEEKLESEKNIDKITKLRDDLVNTAGDLSAKYAEAGSLPAEIDDLKDQLDKTKTEMNSPTRPALKPGQTDPLAVQYTEITKKILEKQGEKGTLLRAVNTLESKYKKIADELTAFLTVTTKKAIPSPTPASPGPPAVPAVPATPLYLVAQAGGSTMKLSTRAQLFREIPTGGTTATSASELEQHIEKFNTDFAQKLKKQIDDDYIKNYKTSAKKTPRVSCYNLLVEIYKQDAVHASQDEQTRVAIAHAAANMAVADVRTIETVKSRNRELAEKALSGFSGGLRKAHQWLSVKSFNSDTFTARDVIEHVSGLDPVFEAFKDLPVDASLNDIRKAMKKSPRPISSQKLMHFYLYLEEAFNQFKVAGHRKVEIADKDWGLETAIRNFRHIHGELLRKEYYKRISHPETEEDKELAKLSKAELFLKLNDLIYRSQQELEKATLDQIRNPDSDWQVSWVKSLMKGKFGEAYQQALAKGKEQGLSGKALRNFVSSEGSIPKTVLKHLMTGLALKEAYDITSKSTKWIGSKLFNASKKAATVGVEKGGSILGAAWRNLGKPAAGATGRGLKALGRGALRVGKFAAWDIWKFSFWTAPKWTVQKAWNITTFPFRMVGRGAKGFWNFFHYTEEKRARDAAWYASKKAASAHAGGGGHGGGGHGGGH